MFERAVSHVMVVLIDLEIKCSIFVKVGVRCKKRQEGYCTTMNVKIGLLVNTTGACGVRLVVVST